MGRTEGHGLWGQLAGLEAMAQALDLEVGGWRKCRSQVECIHPKPCFHSVPRMWLLSSDKEFYLISDLLISPVLSLRLLQSWKVLRWKKIVQSGLG